MALEVKQSLRLSQQLVMTPQLQQAIKLLQLNRLELTNVIQQEMMENPMLEESMELTDDEKKTLEQQNERDRKADEGTENYANEEQGDKPSSDADLNWESYFQMASAPKQGLSTGAMNDDELPSYETTMTKKQSLSDHLLWQLGLSDFSEEEKEIASTIIGNVDENGFLLSSIEDISSQIGCDTARVKSVLELLQEFDPPGVCARDLKESLLLQVKQLKTLPKRDRDIVSALIGRHLQNMERKNYRDICRDLGLSKEAVLDYIRIVATLEPRPGRPFSDSDNHYITPDIYVYKVGDEFVVALNEDGLPRLRISNFYRNLLNQNGSGQTREYINGKLRSAVWLIRSIHQRQRTIHKVTESIVKHQRAFLEKGIDHLRPMVLRDVAEDIGMHESTVSRVTTNKYVHTPQGIFELKYFFNSGISSGDGMGVASESVKDRIKQIISRENPEKPVSDQFIVNELKRDGILIARRTVAKYRELMGILPSSRRKQAG